MSRLKNTTVALVVIALATVILVERRANARLRSEFQRLSNQQSSADTSDGTHEPAPVDGAELDRLRAEHSELMRLRGQVAAARQAQADLTNTRDQLARAESELKEAKARPRAEDPPLAPGLKPSAEFQNAGRARPATSFETLLWANINGATNIVAQSITFDPESRAKAESILAGVSEPLRGQFSSIEEMVAYGMMHATPISGMRVAGEEPIADDEYRLVTEWQYKDGRVQPESWRFQRGADGDWRMVIEPGMMNKLGRMLNEYAAIAKNPVQSSTQ
jgi:hypothetical protein